MEIKDNGNITVDKLQKQKIKCHKFFCKEINRNLMLHEDIENKNYSSVSDEITGFRLFSLPQKVSQVKPEHIKDRMEKFIKHFTKEGIEKEFDRIENLPQPERKKK